MTGETCQYACDDGYSDLGYGYSLCGSDGVFTPVTCRPAACTAVAVDNSNRRGANLCAASTGQDCRFTCAAGFGFGTGRTATGSIQCQPDGTFEVGQCTPLSCSPLVIGFSDRSSSNPCSGVTASVCPFSCNSGFQDSTGVGFVTCSPSGSFTPATCGPTSCAPAMIPNSDRGAGNNCTGRTGESCTFTCAAGYGTGSRAAISGGKSDAGLSGTAYCLPSGQFSTNVGCDAFACEAASVLYSDHDVGNECIGRTSDNCSFVCNQGYAVQEAGVVSAQTSGAITCLADGAFTTGVRCAAVQCQPYAIAHSDHATVGSECAGTTGESCDYACTPGFGSGGTIYCRPDGTFSEGRCVAAMCAPRVIAMSDHDSSNPCAGPTDTVCAFACDRGYVVAVDGVATASRNGSTTCQYGDSFYGDLRCEALACDAVDISMSNRGSANPCEGSTGDSCDYVW